MLEYLKIVAIVSAITIPIFYLFRVNKVANFLQSLNFLQYHLNMYLIHINLRFKLDTIDNRYIDGKFPKYLLNIFVDFNEIYSMELRNMLNIIKNRINDEDFIELERTLKFLDLDKYE